jgi:hypothetical protein
VLYLYAICGWPTAPLPAHTGVGATPLLSISHADLAAIVSVVAAPPAPDEQVVMAHEVVVEALMQERTLLPVRFATCLPDEAAVRALLDSRAASFRANLTRLAGCVELSVRGLLRAPPEVPPVDTSNLSPGRAYIAQRRAEAQAQASIRTAAEAVHQQLTPLAQAAILGPSRGPLLPLNAAYLLPRTDIALFQAAVQRISADNALRLLCTGPWPPYSFVTE